jgi:hypothetical protein
VDLETGKVVRDITVFEVDKPQFCIARNSYASSTPVIEEGRFYAHYGSAGTACVDTQSGKVVWTRQDLPCNHHRGPASSPIVWGDLLILTFDGFDVQYVAALDKLTGKTVWKTDRRIEYGSDNGDIKKAYATPHVIEVAGKPQLLDPSAGAAIAYDPKTGAELWRIRCGGMNVSARPVPVHCGWRLQAVRRQTRRRRRRYHLPRRVETVEGHSQVRLAIARQRPSVYERGERRYHLPSSERRRRGVAEADWRFVHRLAYFHSGPTLFF